MSLSRIYTSLDAADSRIMRNVRSLIDWSADQRPLVKGHITHHILSFTYAMIILRCSYQRSQRTAPSIYAVICIKVKWV